MPMTQKIWQAEKEALEAAFPNLYTVSKLFSPLFEKKKTKISNALRKDKISD